jgi:ketosteroid isomerase-like protein
MTAGVFMGSFSRRWLIPPLLVAALLTMVGIAHAHDFWLIPDAFQIAEGGVLEVRGQTSSRFPTSESAVTPDRVSEARIIGTNEDVRVTDVSTAGTSLVLRHRPRGIGQRIVAVTIGWRSVRASGPGFKRYIELEGNPALAARYEREGLLPRTDSITRRYAKYAKTVVEVGRGGPRMFSRVVGQPLEFVPASDPARLHAGDTLSVRLLYEGKPLADAHVHGGVAVESGAPRDVSLDTDAQGIARVPLAAAGLWNVRTLHVVPAPPGSGSDWESHFATLVFRVGPAATGSDSAEIVRVVREYHDALARRDSAAAIGLLTPDAMVLESGGIETLDEYRAHHLPADIAFAAGVPLQRTVRRVHVEGAMAWVASTSVSQGEFRGRAVNSAGAELMVLTRTSGGWRISAIHWSSRARRQ